MKNRRNVKKRTMNFELLDNAYQILMLAAASVVSIVLSVRHRDRRFMILSFAYASFMIGTLYYTLHLAITGDIPRVFYVAEISWISSYLFYLSLQLYRSEKLKIRFYWLAALAAVVEACHIIYWQIMGDSYLFICTYALIMGAIVYLSVCRIQMKEAYMETDICLLIVCVLQVALYSVSAFMDGFTEFNLYFAVDMTLTTAFVTLLPMMYREVKKL